MDAEVIEKIPFTVKVNPELIVNPVEFEIEAALAISTLPTLPLPRIIFPVPVIRIFPVPI